MEPRSYNKSFIPAHSESGRLAQLEERQLDMLEVGGSKPSPPTIAVGRGWTGETPVSPTPEFRTVGATEASRTGATRTVGTSEA